MPRHLRGHASASSGAWSGIDACGSKMHRDEDQGSAGVGPASSHSTVTNNEQEAIMGSNTPKPNRNDQTAADQTLAAGLTKNAATIPSIMIGGVSVATKDIVAALQARTVTAKAVMSARGSLAGGSPGGP
jgi:hypothetical protein